MADEWVESVRRATDLAEVASRYVNLRKRGQKWVGLCPFHDEKSPSFQIDPDKQLYYCFGCHAGGDVFRLVEKLEHKSFGEAVRHLAALAGIPVPERGTAEDRDRRERFRQAMLFAEGIYRKALASPEGQEARRYLLETRGLTEETLGRFSLGWANGASVLSANLKAGSKTPGGGAAGIAEVLEEAGMIRRGPSTGATGATGGERAGDLFRNRIMIPIRERPGQAPSGFGGRLIEPGSRFPKYLNSAESPYFRKREILFGLDEAAEALKREERALVVEGYFDVMRLSQEGIGGVVAPLGTALGPAHVSLLKRHAREVVLLFDGDRAGRDAAVRIISRFLWDPDLVFRAVWLPDGTDPDQWIVREGATGVRRALEGALPMGDFVLDWLAASLARIRKDRGGEGKSSLVADFLSMVRAFPDLEVQEQLLEQGAILLDTMKDLLAMQLLSGESAHTRETAKKGDPDPANLNNRGLAWRNILVELARLWVDGGTPHPKELWKREDFSFIDDPSLSGILDDLWILEDDPSASLHDLLKRDAFLWKQWYDLPSDPGSRQVRLDDVCTAIRRLSRKNARPVTLRREEAGAGRKQAY
ncbi:MAG: DNA primase [Nitrospiraceae bacterium]|nr:DNA primase [Nitrospiraceae bacterium]